MVMRKTFFCAAFAGALGLGAGAAPVSLESAQDYVRTIAGTNASNVVLYSPTEAVKIIDTVFKPNRDENRLQFNWWDVVFPTVSFKSPATMKDVADFFTEATRPCPS